MKSTIKYGQNNYLTAVIISLLAPSAAWSYIPDSRWTSTASGGTGTEGDPITLTWSLVADGTSIPQEGASNLISFLDGRFGAGGGSDFTLRPWFHLFSESFNRWSALGGINFVYEPRDNGVQLSSSAGGLGVRGDIRIGGANVDGSGSTLAYANFLNGGDIVIDTGETSFFATSANNYRAFRNTFMHELGHAFGLDHVESSTDRLLMEPFIDTSFDGPQLDDIRGIQGTYGDALEKSNGGLGNDVAARAITLGTIAVGATRRVGADAAGGQAVSAIETDFISIANSNDFDFFSFTVSTPSTLGVTLTPLGGVFNQGGQGGQQSSFNANARNDLSLSVYGTNGTTLLGTANNGAAGVAETLTNLTLSAAGQYFVRVSGASELVQLYQVELSVGALESPSADWDNDGDVDGLDFLRWQQSFGAAGNNLTADANGDNAVNAADLAVFRQQFGSTGAGNIISTAVPEPRSVAMLMVASPLALRRFSTRRHMLRHFRS